MADEIMRCDGTDPIHVPEWEPIIGDKTLDNGGYVGDLMTIVRVHLEDAKEKGELREEDSGTAYATAIMEAMKNAIMFELGYPKAELEVCFLRAQIAKLECDCLNDTKRTDSQILLDDAKIIKLECECSNETLMTDSKVSLNAAQENKLACDCCNSSKIATAQSELYLRQSEGFDDNAHQKLYESQLTAWSMIFADSDMEQPTPSISHEFISDSYNILSARLGSNREAPYELGPPPEWT